MTNWTGPDQEIHMRRSPENPAPEHGPGGEGGSRLRDLLTAPTPLTEALTPNGLLTISLLLSALLIGLAATALAG